MAQLEAREDLLVLLRVSVFLPSVSGDKPLCSPFVSHCPHPSPSQAISVAANRICGECTERRKKGVLLLAVMLIQHNTGCVLQLSAELALRGNQCFYRNAVKAKVQAGWQTRRKILQACLIVPALLCRYGLKEMLLPKCTNFPQYLFAEVPQWPLWGSLPWKPQLVQNTHQGFITWGRYRSFCSAWPKGSLLRHAGLQD